MAVTQTNAQPLTAAGFAAPRPRSRVLVDANRATGAYLAFIAFIFTVYSSLPQLIPPLAALAPGKTVIGAAALALVWACIVGRRQFHLGLVAGGTAFFIFFGIIIASPSWSQWPDLSWEAAGESLKYLAVLVIAANVLDTRKRIRWTAAAIAIVSLFPAVGTMISYLRGELLDGTRAYWIGSFANPNFVAYHLVVSTPLAFALRETSRSSLGRHLWLALIGVFAVAILLSGSRGGALGFGAVTLLWFARDLVRGRIALGIAIAVIAALFLAPSSPLNRSDTHENLAGGVDLSAKGRLDAWRTGLNMTYANPVLGVGAGAFVASFEKYAPGDAGMARAAHNSFMLVASELGVPALAIFIVGLGVAFFAVGRAARRAPPRAAVMARGVQIALAGVVVCSMFGGYTFTWPLYFMVGLAAAIVLREQKA